MVETRVAHHLSRQSGAVNAVCAPEQNHVDDCEIFQLGQFWVPSTRNNPELGSYYLSSFSLSSRSIRPDLESRSLDSARLRIARALPLKYVRSLVCTCARLIAPFGATYCIFHVGREAPPPATHWPPLHSATPVSRTMIFRVQPQSAPREHEDSSLCCV